MQAPQGNSKDSRTRSPIASIFVAAVLSLVSLLGLGVYPTDVKADYRPTWHYAYGVGSSGA